MPTSPTTVRTELVEVPASPTTVRTELVEVPAAPTTVRTELVEVPAAPTTVHNHSRTTTVRTELVEVPASPTTVHNQVPAHPPPFTLSLSKCPPVYPEYSSLNRRRASMCWSGLVSPVFIVFTERWVAPKSAQA